MMTDEPKQSGFVPKISLGDVMTAGTIVLASTAWFFKTDSRLNRLDEIIVEMKSEDRQIRSDMKEQIGEVRSDVKETKNAIERAVTRWDRRDR